jgi:O-antigen/teichoic acid export membrane protein
MQIAQETLGPAITPAAPRPSRRAYPRLSPVRRDAAVMLLSGAVIRLCGLAFMMVLSRRLSREDVGVFSFYEALADTLTIIASFSLDSAMIRRIAGAAPGRQIISFAPLLAFRLISAPVYLLCIIIVSHFVRGPHWLLPFVGLYTLTESAYYSFAGFFVGVKRIGIKAAIEAGAELTFTALFLIFLYRYPSIKTVIVLSTVRSTLLLGTGVYLANRYFGPLRIRFAPLEMIRLGAPFVLMSLLGVLQGSMETLLLGFLASLPATGAYQLALKITVSAGFIPQAVNIAVFPHIAAEGLTAINRRRLSQSLILLACLGGGAGLVLFFLSHQVAQILFGPMVTEVAPVLRVIAPALFVRFVTSGMTSVVIALKGENRVFRSMLAGTVCGLTADCLLIPRLGASGAACGMLVSAVCQFILMAAAIRGKLRMA